MADTFSTALKARKIEQGGYDPAWASRFNADVIDIMDAAISGRVSISIGSSTTPALAALQSGTLSDSHYRWLVFTGTPASAVTLTVPASVTTKEYLVDNQTGQNLTIKYAATAGVLVPTGKVARVICDGTTVVESVGNITGTFTATLTGCTTSPTVTARYVRHGQTVTLYVPSNSATSNTTSCTITGAPTLILPTRDQGFASILVVNNGTSVVGLARMQTTGVIDLRPGTPFGATSWTGSGTKGHDHFNVTYNLD